MSATDDTLYASDTGDTAITQPDKVSMATVAIWAYIIPHVYVQFAEYSLALERSRIWNRPDRLAVAREAVKWAFVYNIVIGVVLYLGFSIMVSLLTRDMDRRMTDIVIGTSRVFGAVIFFILSVNMPQWFGVYHSRKRRVATFRSLREVRFAFSWSLWKEMATMFFFNMFFSCRTLNNATLYGILVGIPAGAILIYTVYLARHSWKERKRCLAITIIVVLGIISWFSFLAGTVYIAQVWVGDAEGSTGALIAIGVALLLWPLVLAGCHVAYFVYTRRMRASHSSARFNSVVFAQNPAPGVIVNASKGVTASGTAALQAALGGSGGSAAHPAASSVSKGDDGQGGQGEEGATDAPEDQTRSVSSMPPKEEAPEGTAEARLPGDPSCDGVDDDDDYGGMEQDDEEVQGDEKAFAFVDEAQAPSYSMLFRSKLYETYPYLCCCFKKARLSNVAEPRFSYVVPQKNTFWPRVLVSLRRLIWYLSSFFFLYLTIVNIGATSQQDTVSTALAPAFSLLYPPDFNNGTMCAWDEASSNGTIKTFDTLQDVYDANFTVIHCGACGACSNWNDLTLEWTTRHELAKLSKKCAQKSMFGGEEAVTQCNEDSIGFTRECSECWTYDEINTKNSCFWIYLQSVFIDAVADFSVGFNDITSATCDEALSGPVFVPCSGATRRRMNIVSDIPRPKYQQCHVAQHNWTVVFNHP